MTPRAFSLALRLPPAALAFLLLVVVAAPSAAQHASDARGSVYGYGAFFEPSGDQVSLERATTARQTLEESGTGFGIELDLRWTRRLSVAAGVLFVDLESRVARGALGESQSFGAYAPYLGLDWHFIPASRADVYLGASLVQFNYDDVTFFNGADPEVLRYDDDYGFGLRLGVDWTFSADAPFSLRAELRYYSALLESENPGEDLALDPLMLTVGVGYTW